jgi:D-glycero-D-manno-heptose 1,7-bisphosphate phosphatase
MKKAVFLDRDGTINREADYLRRVEDLRLLPGAAGAIRLLKEMGFLVVVISNQSGIARGLLTPAGLEAVQGELCRRLERRGASIDAFYHCPHLPGAPVREYAVECRCRKPQTGLFEKAAADLGIDFSRSWAIGDRMRDISGPVKLGCRGILVLTGYGKEELKNRGEWAREPDFVEKNLIAAAERIAKTSG